MIARTACRAANAARFQWPSTQALSRWLRRAAAPLFAAMAVATYWTANRDGLFCGVGPSGLCSMTTMYALMAAVHLPAWLPACRDRLVRD